MQVFEVLSSIMVTHPHISLGLIIGILFYFILDDLIKKGGKDLKYEQERINRMNILIATPGRLLQHMNESIGFETLNLKILGENLLKYIYIDTYYSY